jgi:hypothetical protein
MTTRIRREALWVRSGCLAVLAVVLLVQLVPTSASFASTGANDLNACKSLIDPSTHMSGQPRSGDGSCGIDQGDLYCGSNCMALVPSGHLYLPVAQDALAADPLLVISTLHVRPPHPPPKL